MSQRPKLSNQKYLLAVKGRQIPPVKFENSGGRVISCAVSPELPLGLEMVVQNGTCVLVGKPFTVKAKTTYEIKAVGVDNQSVNAFIDIAVQEAPVRQQREEILKVHDLRGDLDTPRSQVENALGDQAVLGSNIKPHEKFINQPMGDDSHLTAQAANNADAQQRAEASPELTPSPSAQLQNQAVLAAKPTIAPTPGK